MQGTKYLGEIIKEEGIELDSNTLIVAPVGSGKTYYILNDLAKDKKILYLCDTTNLKLQILKEDNTQDYAHMLDKNVTVMTYSKFGKEIKFTNDEFINKFDMIVADEVHNLIDYSNFSNDSNLERAIEYLIRDYKNTPIIFFTATRDYLDITANKYNGFGSNFRVLDYTAEKYEGIIRRYSESMVAYLSHFTDVQTYLTRYKRGFETLNLKCLIFSPYIKTMRKLETICGELGLRPISIWSTNANEPMTYDQTRVRNHLIETGELLEPYNVLIINRATETGVNIYDKDMKIMICNCENEVQQIQARGRIRHDIDLLVLKTSDLKQIEFSIDKEILGLWLTKDSIIERVITKNNMRDKNGKLIGIPTLEKRIGEYGYKLESKRKTINRKKITVYMVTKTEN